MQIIARLLILFVINCTLTAHAEEVRVIDLKQLRPQSVSVKSDRVSLSFTDRLPASLTFYTNGTFRVAKQGPFFRVKLDVRDGDTLIGFARAIAPPIVILDSVWLVFESEEHARAAAQALRRHEQENEKKR